MDFRIAERREQLERQDKREKEAPYRSFVRINLDKDIFKAFSEVTTDPAMRILLFIVEHMDKLNALVCSYKVFEDALGISQATVARAIKTLKDKGMIYVMKSGSSNVYIMNDEVAWKSWGSNKKYCKFPANVILSKNDQ